MNEFGDTHTIGMPQPDPQGPAAFSSGSDSPSTNPVNLLQQPVTDLTNADIFAALYGRTFKFVSGWGWMWFDGKRWKNGETQALQTAGNIIAMRITAFNQVEHLESEIRKHVQKRLECLSTAHHLESLLKVAAGKLSVPAEQFDADIYSMNVGNGVLNLITGELSPHSPEQFHTKWSPVEYHPESPSTLWQDTVDGIACHDVELVKFLQMLGGYMATGDVSAQKFYYLYGAGANGKSMFTDLIAEVLGGFGDTGYAVRLANETILGRAERTAGAPSPDLLSLKGKRLALFSEQSGTRPMNPERVKDLSGGDAISARAPHCTPITFHPTHTLVCCGNHIPHVNASDHGFWRRLLVVPFGARFEPSRLAEELRSPENLTAILAWVVKGAVSLLRDGWKIPACVEDASSNCRTESNLLEQWIEECCERSSKETLSTTLYKSYDGWCVQRQEVRMSHSLFTRQMGQLGYARRKSNGRPLLQGIKLRVGQIETVVARPIGTA